MIGAAAAAGATSNKSAAVWSHEHFVAIVCPSCLILAARTRQVTTAALPRSTIRGQSAAAGARCVPNRTIENVPIVRDGVVGNPSLSSLKTAGSETRIMQRSSAILVLVAGMIASQAGGGGDGDSSTTGTTPSSLPLCSGQTYDVSGRWERFPIRVYIEEPELARRGYSAQRIGQLVDLYMRGINSWAVATSNRHDDEDYGSQPVRSECRV